MTDHGGSLDLVVGEDVTVGRVLAVSALAVSAIGFLAGPWFVARSSDDAGWVTLGFGVVFIVVGVLAGTGAIDAFRWAHRLGAHVELVPGGIVLHDRYVFSGPEFIAAAQVERVETVDTGEDPWRSDGAARRWNERLKHRGPFIGGFAGSVTTKLVLCDPVTWSRSRGVKLPRAPRVPRPDRSDGDVLLAFRSGVEATTRLTAWLAAQRSVPPLALPAERADDSSRFLGRLPWIGGALSISAVVLLMVVE